MATTQGNSGQGSNYDQRGQRVEVQYNIGEVTVIIQRDTKPDVAELLKRAVTNIQLQRYDAALQFLDDLFKQDDNIAEAYYYHSLALLKGKRPRLTVKSTAEVMERSIAIAHRLRPGQAHYYYLWAWLRHDFYQVNGIRAKGPSTSEILQAAASCPIDVPRCNELLQHSGADASSAIYQWMQQH